MIGFKAEYQGEIYPYTQVTTYGDGSVACTGISMDGFSWLSPDIDKIKLTAYNTGEESKQIGVDAWKLKEIENTLRMASNIHNSSRKETCFDRCVCGAWKYAKEALGKI
jgi:hypothetical protein